VGGDVFGRFIREDLHNRGIDTSRISESQKSETSKTIIITVEGEDRRYLHLLGANADFELEDVDLSYATSGKILYVGGFLGMAGFSAKDCHHLFRHAREKKVTTVLDVITPGPGDYFEMFRDVLPQVDVFLPNTDEAEVICGEREPEKQADCFLDLGAGTVVITMGTEGVLAKSSEGILRVGRYAVPFVDGSGAGDAFDAGLLYALLQEQPLDEALRYASAMGAACVREVGCLDSLFSQEELTAFVRQHSLPMEVRSG
jgi:sugar/nucleoside kinase (ribokinase family)